MWLEIDERLGPMGSTSAWIARAIKEKLEGNTFTVGEATNVQLLTALFNRGSISIETYKVLKDKESSRQQVEQPQNHRRDRE
jgi:hypothetical protein